MDRYFLRKSQRLVSGDDFRRVLSHKCFECKGILRLYAAANHSEQSRFGISVSNACGNAVQRNRLKRLGREVFRQHQHQIPAGFDYVLIFTRKVPKKSTKGDPSRHCDEAESLQYKDIESRLLGMIQTMQQKNRLANSG